MPRLGAALEVIERYGNRLGDVVSDVLVTRRVSRMVVGHYRQADGFDP